MDRQKVIGRTVQRLFNDLEAEYAEARRDELGILHNKVIGALTEIGASPQNTLLVLEIIKQEVLQDCLDKFFGKAADKPSEKAPEPSKSKSGGSVV